MAKVPPNHLIPNDINISDKMLINLAQEYGTPLYVYDSKLIKKRWKVLSDFLPNEVTLYYSVKANPNKEIIDIYRKLGASFEIVSGGELRSVLYYGEKKDKIIFVGPGKTDLELELAIDNGVNVIIIESLNEAKRIQVICERKDVQIDAALRINAGKGKGIIAMGGATQFGMDVQTAIYILEHKKEFNRINFRGIHSYLGTGNLEMSVVLEHTELILNIANDIMDATNCCFNFIDIGGGLGLPCYSGDNDIDLDGSKDIFNKMINDFLVKNPSIKDFIFEAGRYLVGPAGIFLATVIDVKETHNGMFIILDGGTNVFGGDNKYRGFKPTPVRLLNEDRTNERVVSICGPLCTSADRLASDIVFPLPQIGDILAFYLVGAYGLTSCSGLFLSHGFPREILVEDEKVSLIRECIL